LTKIEKRKGGKFFAFFFLKFDIKDKERENVRESNFVLMEKWILGPLLRLGIVTKEGNVTLWFRMVSVLSTLLLAVLMYYFWGTATAQGFLCFWSVVFIKILLSQTAMTSAIPSGVRVIISIIILVGILNFFL
jgi:hypothetical protein